MKKIDVSHTIAVVANLGVIAGIVFLGLEIRQTNIAVTGSAYQARSLALMERQDQLADSSYLGPISYKADTEGWHALSDQEKHRMRQVFLGAMFRLDGTFFSCQIGHLDEGYCDSVFVGEMSVWVPRWRDSGVLEQWGGRGILRDEFMAEIDKYMNLPSNSAFTVEE